MQAYAEGFEVMEESEFDLDLHEIAGIWRYGSVVRSWLLELRTTRFEKDGDDLGGSAATSRTRARAAGRSHEAIAEDVPVPVITAALFARFASRQDESFAAKVNAALRNEFGGHAVEDANDRDLASENPLLEGLQLRRHARAVHLRDLRRVRRPDAAQADPRALLARVPALLPEKFAVVGAARTEDVRRRVPRARWRRPCKEHARDPFRRGRLGELAERDALHRDRVRRRRRARIGSRRASTRSTRSAAPKATASTTSPCRRPRSATLVQELGERRSAEGWTRLDDREAVRTRPRLRARADERSSRSTSPRSEIFRIDHYLGKETVQNMLALRFANGIFEPIWNRQFIDHVQITVAETIGHRGPRRLLRAGGRDPRHLPEPPAAARRADGDGAADRLHGGAVRNEKVKVLRSLHTPGPEVGGARPVRAAATSRARRFRGYREEEGVAPDSMTDTYVAAKLYVDNWRWADTPFYVRMGKRLARRETTIAIQFKSAPHPPFEEARRRGCARTC